MEHSLHFSTKVLRGQRIELMVPQFTEGVSVDVYVVPSPAPEAPRVSVLELIKGLNGHRLFQSPSEVDAYLEAERNSWDD